MGRLTEKQERFCHEYLVDFHQQFAAIRAGYPAAGAATASTRMLKNAKIQDRIAEIRAQTSINTGASIERTVAALAKMAYVDPAEMYNSVTGELLPISQMPAHVRAAIVAIEQDEIKVDGMVLGIVKKVKLAPREKAADMLLKHFGGYAEDNKQKKAVFEIIVDIVDDDDEKPQETANDNDDEMEDA